MTTPSDEYRALVDQEYEGRDPVTRGRTWRLRDVVGILVAAELTLRGALERLDEPETRGIPSIGLRASLSYAQQAAAAALRGARDELEFLERPPDG